MYWQISQQLPPDYKIRSMIVVIEELTVHIHLNVTACGAAYCPVEASYSCPREIIPPRFFTVLTSMAEFSLIR